MTVQLAESGPSPRMVEIDGRSDAAPDVVFIDIDGGACVGFDRAEFIAAVKAEFGLIDPLEALFDA